MEIIETNHNQYINSYWVLAILLLYGVYILYSYTTYVIVALIAIYINKKYSDTINAYIIKIVDNINNKMTGYLGNCAFDPLPKSKT